MTALLSTLLGFLSSGIPHLLDYFKSRQDNAHELAMLQMQIEAAKIEAQGKIQVAEYQSAASIDVAEQQRFMAEAVSTGIHWVEAVRATVRPVITYWIFGLYTMVKVWQYQMIAHPALPWQLQTLWTEDDAAILCAVVAFHFGSRSFNKIRGQG